MKKEFILKGEFWDGFREVARMFIVPLFIVVLLCIYIAIFS